MTPAELDVISEAVGIALKEAIVNLREEMRVEYRAHIAEQILAIPAPVIPEIQKFDLAELADAVVARMPLPKAAEPEPIDTDAIVLRVAELFRQPEDGKPGKDGESVDRQSIIDDVLMRIPKPEDGKDADPELVRQLVSTEVTRAVSGLPVAKDGAPGARGEPGEAGKSIHPDTVALMVREAFDRMPKPENGKPGEPGKSALEIDPITVDPEKSYPRGTVAAYNGGTVRANRTTTPGPDLSMPEWDVLLDGTARWIVTQSEDFRSITVEAVRTTGKRESFTFAYPVVLDRGGYKSGDTYERGDSVSRDGQTWICQAETTTAAPGMANDDWRLSVRRGQNGKDLRPPEPPAPRKPIGLS